MNGKGRKAGKSQGTERLLLSDSPAGEAGFQSRKQIDRGDKRDQSFYRCNNTTVMIPVPIGDRTFKDEIGERKEVMMPIVMMRHKVETAVEEHTPSKDR